MTVRLARMSETPLSLDEHIAAVESTTAGAVTTFVGRVRDHDPDATDLVVALEYSAHPDAEQTLARIATDAAKGTDALVAVSHRTGRLVVGDAAVVIAVASAHRDEAFVVCREVIEAIKRDLPVWKRQIEADGTSAWKGLGG
ncbi:molybdenum cofactor biosynthesis protein MoaE [Microbacterium esteraromaticum]|uniref:Molybdenum cofactor biosynthesis protein MoaE n=1 Tax=Microbacterium esteraromaticum TaxID=57043 RepID=A0A939DY68_9MICO|nr:molybdenum cofactor biosynthesis protein MoaE [Microbacterium esteraromaticum]MBN7794407.1 molybdenum cofactor biosynthesis protein MoaE [Microbacterium esteraromaticum]MBN8207075.1 molybdenum cofactor biosynthesis protein MoaE [Microbacterium esteraromaticum]MBN8417229.1 molybdenum cofactor biosynthesis protein MoaE [Microbacterium esteraromaticum]MBN8425278.1 molybdenum cofactor biosynthesis protein MoaE [Microbacterium esteraromaticum]